MAVYAGRVCHDIILFNSTLNRRAMRGSVEFDICKAWICNFLNSVPQLPTRFEALSVFSSDYSPPELKSQAYNFSLARAWHAVALLGMVEEPRGGVHRGGEF